MTTVELKAKYGIGRRQMSATLGCGHKVYGLTEFGVQDKTREFRTEAKQLACDDCGTVAGDPATPKQLKYARSLIRQHEGEYTAHGQLLLPKLLQGISKAKCSQLIDDLLTNR